MQESINIISCPKCKQDVLHKEDKYICGTCGMQYNIEGGITNFVFRELPDELKAEIKWYGPDPNVKLIFNRSNTKAHSYAHALARNKILHMLRKYSAGANSKVLCIAVGDGCELPYIKPITSAIYGIDISLVALQRSVEKYNIKGYLSEAKYLPFKTNSFDFIIVSAFIHHFASHDEAGDYFKEFKRVLKQKGIIMIVEPNLFYPLNLILYPIRKIVEKIFPGGWGGVEHEKPVTPFYLMRTLKSEGFVNIEWEATTFTHNRMPEIISKIIDKYFDLLRGSVFKYFGWWMIFTAQKGIIT